MKNDSQLAEGWNRRETAAKKTKKTNKQNTQQQAREKDGDSPNYFLLTHQRGLCADV